ncbi:MAG TPA: hypothetical protein DIT25_03700 [Candidatus Moranbacteria bacterium]|nr:hypothetical protein [Candidatus Moranbacteria bacterium]
MLITYTYFGVCPVCEALCYLLNHSNGERNDIFQSTISGHNDCRGKGKKPLIIYGIDSLRKSSGRGGKYGGIRRAR